MVVDLYSRQALNNHEGNVSIWRDTAINALHMVLRQALDVLLVRVQLFGRGPFLRNILT